jgi:hypothetical protein
MTWVAVCVDAGDDPATADLRSTTRTRISIQCARGESMSVLTRNEPVARVRELVAGGATPQRLRRVGAVLLVGALLAGVVGLAGGLSRTSAVGDEGARLAALSADAAEIYRSLADADAMATSGYVSGGTEPEAVRDRFDADVAAASARLVQAASGLAADDPATDAVVTITSNLPVYTGFVESARTYNRLGLPLGQSYLGAASTLMRETILPAAAELRAVEYAALDASLARGGSLPVAVVVLGIAALVGVVHASVRERRRTNRVLNLGLVGAAAALVVLVVWWVAAAAVADGALRGADGHGDAARALEDAHAAALQARSNESLVLVARGGAGASDQGFTAQIDRVLAPGGFIDTAAAADPGADLSTVRAAAERWRDAHVALRALDDGGRFPEAVASATGADPQGSGVAFAALDATLDAAIEAQRTAFAGDAAAARAAVDPLPAASAVLGVLAAVGIVLGIGRRLGEYR